MKLNRAFTTCFWIFWTIFLVVIVVLLIDSYRWERQGRWLGRLYKCIPEPIYMYHTGARQAIGRLDLSYRFLPIAWQNVQSEPYPKSYRKLELDSMTLDRYEFDNETTPQLTVKRFLGVVMIRYSNEWLLGISGVRIYLRHLHLIGFLFVVGLAKWYFSARRCQRKRRSQGQCENCGYDLRATPVRCPECGTVVVKSIVKTPTALVRNEP